MQLTMGYNANRQQPITMKVGPNGAGSIINYTYEYYDASGHNNNRIRSITDGVDPNYSVNYTYDKWNRLTHATTSVYPDSRYYTYDAFGNLRTAVRGDAVQGGVPLYTLNYAQNATTAPANNRILSVTENGATQPFTYDNAGNLTQGDGMTYAYDAANRMVSVNGGALGQYGYDGEGMRVKKVEGSGTVWYVRSSVVGNAFEVTSAGVQRAYVSVGGKLVAEQTTDGQFHWVHTNHLGNARAMTDASGNFTYKGQFDPHGQALWEWSASGNPNLNAKKFTGYERDEATGLDYAGARQYKSGRGRFTQPDPVTAKELQRLNRYTYANNDPVNYVDSDGKDPSPFPPFPIPMPGGVYNPPSNFPNNSTYGLEQAKQSCMNNGGIPQVSTTYDGIGRAVPSFNCVMPQQRPRPRVTIAPLGPAKELSGCGGAEWKVVFAIQGGDSASGWIVQNFIQDIDITGPKGEKLQFKREVFEAWKVVNGIAYTIWPSQLGVDTYFQADIGIGTRGDVKVTGTVKYFFDSELSPDPSTWPRGGADGTGVLNSFEIGPGRPAPSGWNNTSGVPHSWELNWNCTHPTGPYKTNITTTPN